MLNSFFFISENIFIFILFLKYRFTGYVILGWQLFWLGAWAPLHGCFLVSIVPVVKPAVTSSACLSPATLKILSSLWRSEMLLCVSRVHFFLIILLVSLLYFVYLWLYTFLENSQVVWVQILPSFYFRNSFLLELWLDRFSLPSSKTVNLSVVISCSSFFVLFWVIYLVLFYNCFFCQPCLICYLTNVWSFFFNPLYSFLKVYVILFIIWFLLPAHFHSFLILFF